MDPIATILIITLILISIYQFFKRALAEGELQELQSELKRLIAAIEAVNNKGNLMVPVASNKLTRILSREFTKINLENRLNKRIKNLSDTHLGHKPEIK